MNNILWTDLMVKILDSISNIIFINLNNRYLCYNIRDILHSNILWFNDVTAHPIPILSIVFKELYIFYSCML
jgi:hypothetical protein